MDLWARAKWARQAGGRLIGRWQPGAELPLAVACLIGFVGAVGDAHGDEPVGSREPAAVVRESLAFEHLHVGLVKRACNIGSVCTASWRIEASGHIEHRDGERLFQGTLPSDTLAAVAAMAVSADVVSELRQPDPCPDRTKTYSDIEVGFVPGLAVTAHTGDCNGQHLGALTGAVRQVAKAMFPTSRSSDDLLPELLQGPPQLGRLRHRHPTGATRLARQDPPFAGRIPRRVRAARF
jgi:hypothetical protein